MAKKITKKPSLAVKNLKAPTRGNNNHIMAASWKIPSDLVSSKKKDRAEGLEIDWILDLPGKNNKKKITTTGNEKLTTSSINLNNLKIGKTTYTRSSFYPVNSKRKLYGVTAKVTPKNKKGKGKSASEKRKFEVPRAPKISAFSFNTETGRISTTIETDAGDDYKERYDTRYILTVTSPFINEGKPKNTSDDSSTSTSFSVGYDATQYQQLDYEQYIKVEAKAYARGYAGDNPSAKKPITRTAYISYPAQASIEKVLCPNGRDSTSKCTVLLKTNSTTEHPVDSIRLQIAADVTYDDPDDIPGNEWENTDIVDNAKCTAMSISTSELIPTRGNYTYVRLKTHHLHEGVLYRYSEPKRVEALELKTAPSASIDVDILEAHAGDDGKSAVVLLGWNKDGLDDYTGTELSWSENINTWRSTEEPNTHEFTWSDGAITKDGVTYHDSAEITIKGLSEGETYYIKARRYLEAENAEYSDYTLPATVTTNERPESIVASCARYVADGNPLMVYWTLVGNGLQTSWRIEKVVNGELTGTVIANGEGSLGSIQIDADRLAKLATNGTLSFKVFASTGSTPVESDIKTVTIIEQPTLTISAANTLTSQPFSFTATSNRLCNLIAVVTAQGVSGQFPQGQLRQVAGDVIHSNIYTPVWENNSAVIELPDDLDFWDGGSYTLSVIAVDRETALRSSEVLATFNVAWSTQAVSPVQYSYNLTTDTEVVEDESYYEFVGGEYILVTPNGSENPSSEGWYIQNTTSFVTLTVIDEKDSDGDHTQAVEINLTPPAGSSETDVYDIYRMDVENPHLISGETGFPLTYTVVDEYAPFGDADLRYRISIRTIDGDVEFSDIEYEAECKNIRFDWNGGSLELPYGNTIGDSFAKDVDIRKHMNGISNGYWNQGVEHKSSLGSAIIKIVQPKDIERARNLARYSGPVFVRLPNGSAFEADVQVTDLSVKNEAITTVAFDAIEIGLTNEFSLPIPFKMEE